MILGRVKDMLSDKELNKQIGAALREERKRRRYTLEYIGDVIGVSKSTVYLWESGRNGISAAMLKRYCEALNITVSDIARIIKW